mmetsp:Transcript_37617/g.69380  ORF Transcript_37617/g.69380 Transcript_37617/m.69380 type:complete len:291 (-) Transcript_37617:717-1589(-)
MYSLEFSPHSTNISSEMHFFNPILKEHMCLVRIERKSQLPSLSFIVLMLTEDGGSMFFDDVYPVGRFASSPKMKRFICARASADVWHLFKRTDKMGSTCSFGDRGSILAWKSRISPRPCMTCGVARGIIFETPDMMRRFTIWHFRLWRLPSWGKTFFSSLTGAVFMGLASSTLFKALSHSSLSCFVSFFLSSLGASFVLSAALTFLSSFFTSSMSDLSTTKVSSFSSLLLASWSAMARIFAASASNSASAAISPKGSSLTPIDNIHSIRSRKRSRSSGDILSCISGFSCS